MFEFDYTHAILFALGFIVSFYYKHTAIKRIMQTALQSYEKGTTDTIKHVERLIKAQGSQKTTPNRNNRKN